MTAGAETVGCGAVAAAAYVLMRRARILLAVAVVAAGAGGVRGTAAQLLLVPMDRAQADHLKAYGLAYRVLEQDGRAEWLLNFQGGAFLLPDSEGTRRRAALMGVTVQPVGVADEARIRGIIAQSNMESVVLEKATRIAIYTPPNSAPWDDAVTMALDYAEIPYEKIWDIEVLREGLDDFEWLHLHHEDFTGQYSKFYITYAGAPWLEEEVARNEEAARELGYSDVPALKKAVSRAIRDYVEQGGFLFAMCSAPETLELALAAASVDIAAAYSDGTPPDADARRQDGLGARDGLPRRPHPALALRQLLLGHRRAPGQHAVEGAAGRLHPVRLLGQVRPRPGHAHAEPRVGVGGFLRTDHVVRHRPSQAGSGQARRRGGLGEVHPRQPWRGHLDLLRGATTRRTPSTRSAIRPPIWRLHPNSPGYRLILNNVLFPAAKKKKLKT